MGWHPGCWVVHVKLTIASASVCSLSGEISFPHRMGMGHNDVVTVSSPEKENQNYENWC